MKKTLCMLSLKTQKKRKFIYVLDQWVTLIPCAKVIGDPYTVFEISNTDFLNFKPLVEDSQLNWSTADDKSKIKSNNIKKVSSSSETPFKLSIKYDLKSVDYITLSLIKKRQRGTHGQRVIPNKAYTEKYPLKKKQLRICCHCVKWD